MTQVSLEDFEQRQADKVLKPKSLQDRTVEYIERLTAGNFYGIVELTFVAGKVTLIKKTQTIKP